MTKKGDELVGLIHSMSNLVRLYHAEDRLFVSIYIFQLIIIIIILIIKYLDFARGLKKTMEHEGDDYTYRDWYTRFSN